MNRARLLVFCAVFATACDSGRGRSSFVYLDAGGGPPRDSGLGSHDGSLVDSGLVVDSGARDCSDNPNRCAANELTNATCECLGICRSGYVWEPNSRQCLPDPTADAGVPRDAGSPPVRDAGITGMDAGPPRDAGATRDAGTPSDAGSPRDAGTPLDAGSVRDAGAPLDAGSVRDGGPPRDAGTTPGVGQLDAACTTNADCQSAVCFDLGGSVGGRCVAACSNAATCGAGFTCYDFEGAKMCLSSAHFTSATFSSPNGAMCSAGAECRSNYCSASSCLAQCSADVDCGGTGACAYREFVADNFIAACDGPVGLAGVGAACMAPADCASGICAGGACRAPCRSTASCPTNQACLLYDFSVCVLELVLCLQYEPNFVQACGPTQHGTQPVGAACTNDLTCRSGRCDITRGTCTDHCRHDSDCPATHRCKVQSGGSLSDGTPYFTNLCLPTGA